MSLSYQKALRLSLLDAFKKYPDVILIRENLHGHDGSYEVSKGFLHEFGPDRIFELPRTSSTVIGASVGMALGHLRPIVELMTPDFELQAIDHIINSVAFFSHFSGGQWRIPLIIRLKISSNEKISSQHSNSLTGWCAHVPGLIILSPATVEDARYALTFALQEPNPVLIFEYLSLFETASEIPIPDPSFSIFKSKIQRPGDHITLVTYGKTLSSALQAAQNLSTNNISVEVIDLRVLRPLDMLPIIESVKKTRRLIVIEDDWKSGGLSAEICARVAEAGVTNLKHPIIRLGRLEIPSPQTPRIEKMTTPQSEHIEAKIRESLRHDIS